MTLSGNGDSPSFNDYLSAETFELRSGAVAEKLHGSGIHKI